MTAPFATIPAQPIAFQVDSNGNLQDFVLPSGKTANLVTSNPVGGALQSAGQVIGAGPTQPVACMVPVEQNGNESIALTSTTPVPFHSGISQMFLDVILPAGAGDMVEYILNGNASAAASSGGLIFSVWSIGGSAFREWKTGTTGAAVSPIASANAFLSIAAGSGTPNNRFTAKVQNKVLPSDIDALGYITLRLYAANGSAGSYSHTWYSYSGSGYGTALGVNWRNGLPPTTSRVTAFPGFTAGGTGLITTSGTAGTSIAPLTDSTGQHTFDLTIAAQPFDVLKFDFQLLIAASANCNPVLSAWTVGGSKSRSLATWIQGSAPTAGNTELGKWTVGGGTAVGTAYMRVLDTDIVNGFVTVRMYATDNSSSVTPNTTVINASDGAGNFSYAQLTNIASEFSLLLASPLGLSGGAPQEPTVFQDSSGLWNMLYTQLAIGNYAAGCWWATAPNLAGPYTVVGTTPLLASSDFAGEANVYQENGLIYVYYRSAGGGNLMVRSGTSLKTLSAATTAYATSSFNSAICKGPGGIYFLFVDSTGPANFVMGVATATTPVGPFTLLSNSLTGVNWASANVCGSPWVEWTGEYFRMFYHTAPVAGATTPTYVYEAVSFNGINWTIPNVNLAGTPTPVARNNYELNWNQIADPFCVRAGGQLFMVADLNQGTSPAAIVINNVAKLPISAA